jgi:hypothetical protein
VPILYGAPAGFSSVPCLPLQSQNGMNPETAIADMLKALTLVVAALFPIVNPLGGATIFLSTTEGYPAQGRAALARKVAIYGFVLLLASILLERTCWRFSASLSQPFRSAADSSSRPRAGIS